MTPADRLEGLTGRWLTQRVIRHRDGTVARFTGTTLWRPDGAETICSESGQLVVADATPFAASRTTRWSATATCISVTFADGRPFHVIAGRNAHHDCPPDDYRLRYDFSAWPEWSVRWQVTGPRKDYRALTRYRRK